MESIGIEPRQLLMQLINFTLMIVVLTKLLYKPIIKVLEDRRKKIQESLDLAEKTRLDMEKAGRKKEELLNEARKEAKEIVSEAKKAATQVEAEITKKAHSEAQVILEKGRKEMEAERVKMEKELKNQTVEIAAVIAEKAIGQILSTDNQRSIIEKKLKELEKVVQ